MNKNSSIETLMKKIYLVNNEKNEFEWRQNSKLKNFAGKLGLIDSFPIKHSSKSENFD